MSPPSRSARLRALVEDDRIVVRPSAYDALSARILEASGFACIGMSGYSLSVTLLGKPDAGFVTLTENALMCRYICAAVDIPVMVDADTGYGNALNVMRTTEALIGAGAAGLFIEDQVEPKRCGHVAGKQLVTTEDMVAKVRAADKVRRAMDPDFVLMARTDARGAVGGGFELAIDRALAYVEAGADTIFPEGLLSADEIAEFVARVPVPISYNRTGVSPMLGLEELQALGVSVVANASGAVRASARAMIDTLADWRRGEPDPDAWEIPILADVPGDADQPSVPA